MADKLPRLEDFGIKDPGVTGGGKPPAKLPTLEDLNVNQEEGLAGKVQPYKYEGWGFQPKLGGDQDSLRAQNQSGWKQTGLFLANLVPNIVGSFIENLGYLGTLGTEWGDDRDYNNAFVQLGQSIKNPFGQIFREHPNQAFDLGDPAWWFQNVESLVESATAFAGEGVGLGKVFSKLGELARFGSSSREVAGLTRAAAHLATASTLAYTEAAQFGATTYNTVYQEQYQKLFKETGDAQAAHDQAKHIASQGAAAAVQLNTMFATVLNLGALAPLFKDDESITNWFRKAGARQPGESYDAWTARLEATNSGSSDVQKVLNSRKQLYSSYLGEVFSEGTEELVNQWAEQRGLERGKKGDTMHGLEDLLGDVQYFFDDTMNAQGALSFIMGGFGGLAQTALIDHIPYHKVYQTEDGQTSLRKFDAEVTPDGKYKTKFINSHTREAAGNRALFDNTKDAILHDVKTISETKDQLAKAVAAGDKIEAEKLRFKLFDTAAINSIQLGLGESFAGQFEDIANIDNTKSLHEDIVPQIDSITQQIDAEADPQKKAQLIAQRTQLQNQADKLTGVTEAMQRGFAASPRDNDYQRRAQQAKSDIDEYTKQWDKLQKKYNTGDEWDAKYADYVFYKDINVRRKGKILDEFQRTLEQSEAQRDQMLPEGVDPVTTKTISDSRVNSATRKSLVEDMDLLKKAVQTGDEAFIAKMVEKYSPNADSSSDLGIEVPGIIKQISNSIRALDSDFNKNIESIEATDGYQAWKAKHPKKEMLDYLKSAAAKDSLTEGIEADKIHLSKLRQELDINKQNLNKLQSDKGRRDYIRGAKLTHNRLINAVKNKIDKDNKQYLDELFDEKNVEDLDKVQKEQFAKALTAELQRMEAELADKQTKRNEVQEQINGINEKGLINRAKNVLVLRKLTGYLNNLTKQINELQEQIKDTQGRLGKLAAGATLDEAKVPGPQAAEGAAKAAVIEPIATSPLIDVVQRVAGNEMTASAILAVLDDYEQDLKEGKQQFSLNFLNQQGFVKPGLLSQSEGAEIMHEFGKQVGAVQQQKEELKPTLVAPLQAKINTLNEQRAQELAALKKGSKGVVAKRKEINERFDDQIKALTGRDITIAPNSEWSEGELASGENKGFKILLNGKEIGSVSALIPGKNNEVDIEHILINEEYRGKGYGTKAYKEIIRYLRARGKTLVAYTDTTTQYSQRVWNSLTKLGWAKLEGDKYTSQIPGVSNVEADEEPNDGMAGEITSTDDLPADEDTYTEPAQPELSYVEEIWNHEGDKVEDSAKINTLTHEYHHDIHDSSYQMISTGQLNDGVNPLYLQHGYLKAGSEVTLQVDENWDGSVNDYSQFVYGSPVQKDDKFKDYLMPDGTINPRKMGMLPIKIVDKRSGTILGYLPTEEWITAKFPNASGDYRNIVDIKYDKDGNLVYSDNVETQRKLNLNLRQKIALAYANGMKQGIDTKISSRSVGKIQTSHPLQASVLLPDKSLRLAVQKGKTFRTEQNTPESNVNAPGGEFNNVPGALLPAPNGELVFVPLTTNLLGKAEVDTVRRAIEIYLTVDGDVKVPESVRLEAKKHAQKILDETGFDILDSKGLEQFINQFYYYTTNFSDAVVRADATILKGQKRVPKFMLSISKAAGEGYSKAYIKIGVSFLNRLAKAQIDENGRLNTDFISLLYDPDLGLASRYRNIVFSKVGTAIKGINSEGPIKEMVWHPGTREFSARTHDSYNDLVKSNSTTTVEGRLKLPSGEHVYFAHPNTQLDYKSLMDTDIMVSSQVQPSATEFVKYEEAPAQEAELTEAEKEFLRSISTNLNDDFNLSKKHTAISSVGDVQGTPLSLSSLENLLNFTPIENRNGKTPVEVLEELTKLGLVNIPEGMNPFYSCK